MKKTGTVIAVLLLIAMALTACGGGAPATGGTTTAPASTAAANAAATTTAAGTVAATTAATTTAAADDTSEAATTAAVTTAAATTAAADEEMLEIELMTALYSPVDMENDFWTKTWEMLNTKLTIDWVPAGTEFDTKLDMLIASGDIPEMMSIEGAQQLNLVRAINEGYFWDVKPYVGDFANYPNMATSIQPQVWDYLANNGGWYRIPRPRAYINVQKLVREDWFERAGYADISQLTLDEVVDALETFVRDDYAGNGRTIGLPFSEDEGALFGTFDMMPDENGTIWPNVLSDPYTEMIEWYSTMFAKGLMSEEFSIVTGGQTDEMFNTSQLGYIGKNTWHCFTMTQEAQKVQPDARVRPLTVVTNGDHTMSMFDAGFVGAVLISSKVPEEKMLRMLDYVNKTLEQSFADYVSYGDLGYHHEIVDGAPTLTDIGKEQINNSTNIPFAIYCPEWFKVDSPVAPKAFNDEIHERCQITFQYGRVNPWRIVSSDTYASEWPAFSQDFTATRTRAIMGQITMDEYREYVNSLRADPLMIKAAEEFTVSRNTFFPDGNLKLGR